jgi:3-oxoadipate enol-lactonase
METLNLPNSTISYIRCGHGNPLVLLHGYPLDRRIWDPILPLLENDFELIIPDLRGFGESKTIDDSYSISEMADDVAKLVEMIGFPKVFLAGHSMGGYVSLAFARSYPDKLCGLGLISSQAIADTPEKKASRYFSLKQLQESGKESIANPMVGKLTSNSMLQNQIYNIILSQSEPGIKCAIQALAERPDQTSLLGKLEIPVLVVHGDSDELIPVGQAVEDSQAAGNSNLVVIAKAGHMPMLEYPEDTASALRWFNNIIRLK